MKSGRNPIHKLARNLRGRSNKSKHEVQDGKSTDSASSTEDGYSNLAESTEALARDDPLLPALLAAVKDYQLTHGSLVKLSLHPATRDLPIAHTVLAHPIGVSLVPTLWPEERFHEAWELQALLQELYARVASDPGYLWDILKDCIASDSDGWSDEIISALWKIHESVQDDTDGLGQVQDIELGLCRGDWMLDIGVSTGSHKEHSGEADESSPNLIARPELKQVELNTVAVAGGSHSDIVSKMHAHLLRTGIYSQLPSKIRQASADFAPLPMFPPFPKLAPNNNSIQGFAQTLANAHELYGLPKSATTAHKAVLMLVQHNNVNIADERPIEYTLWDMDPPVPCFRCEYREVMSKTWFGSVPTSRKLAWQKHQTGRELLFKPYPGDSTVYEISVVYHRGSITAHELSSTPFPDPDSPHTGFEIRLYLERSCAIKCPSVLGQLASSKKVQQNLSSTSGAMERFLNPVQAQRLRGRCMPMSSLADPANPLRQVLDECIRPFNSNANPEARHSALTLAEKALAPYVLKPIGAEGGGHCVFGCDIPHFYTDVIAPTNSQAGYILMQRIHPPVVRGALISQRGFHVGNVVSELGILGTCLWRRTRDDTQTAEGLVTGGASGDSMVSGIEILSNQSVGWTLKSKSENVPEMSVIKGYGCFDTPCLVSWEMYQAEAREGVKDW